MRKGLILTAAVALGLMLVASWPALAPSIARAATIDVNSTADIVAVDGACTLREAIDNANDDAATHPDCAAGSGADTITFSVTGTITLNGNRLPTIVTAITILGDGAITIDAAGQSKHFLTWGNLTLSGLTLENGTVIDLPGGAITNGWPGSELTIIDSTLSGNRSILATPGAEGGFGGAIANRGGHVSLSNVTLSGNSAASGGAISNNHYADGAGTMTISHSVLRGNSAVGGFTDGMDGGGAILNGAPGISSELTISDSILEENTSNGSDGGGAILNAGLGILDVTGSTFTGNHAAQPGRGGAIANPTGTVEVGSSTFSNNVAFGSGGAISNVGGTLGVADSGLSGNSSGYGGAIDNGPGGDATVATSALSDNGAGMHAGAIWNEGSLTLTDSIVSSNHASWHAAGGIYNTSSGTMTVTGSTVSDNFAGGSLDQIAGGGGGGIVNRGELSLDQSMVSGNSANAGGGINNEGEGTLTLTNSTVSGNSALSGDSVLDGMGGGIFNAGTLDVADSAFTGNSAIAGGAIYSAGFEFAGSPHLGTLRVARTEFSANSATGGAAILVAGSEAQAEVVNSTLSGNAAENAGGGTALVDDGGSLILTHVTLWDAQGGGLVNEDGTTTAVNSIVFACSGTIGGSNNLALTGSGCPTAGFTLADDLLLGPLQSNGGPTETHRPMLGSPAINAADNTYCPAVDQRGLARPQPTGGICDIGSVEVILLVELTEAVGAPRSTQALAGRIEASITDGKTSAACGQLTGFTKQVEAQAGKKLTEAEADSLILAATQLRGLLGC